MKTIKGFSSERRKRGRPRKNLNAEAVSRFIGQGFTVEWVANYLGCSRDLLYDQYSDALRKGRALRNGCLQRAQFLSAVRDGNVTMLIWLGKRWLGQTDNPKAT